MNGIVPCPSSSGVCEHADWTCFHTDLSDVKPVAAIDVASSAVAQEVDATQAKVTEQVEKVTEQVKKAHVATRDVELPTIPAVEKKVEKPESKKPPRKLRVRGVKDSESNVEHCTLQSRAD